MQWLLIVQAGLQALGTFINLVHSIGTDAPAAQTQAHAQAAAVQLRKLADHVEKVA